MSSDDAASGERYTFYDSSLSRMSRHIFIKGCRPLRGLKILMRIATRGSLRSTRRYAFVRCADFLKCHQLAQNSKKAHRHILPEKLLTAASLRLREPVRAARSQKSSQSPFASAQCRTDREGTQPDAKCLCRSPAL